VIYTNLLVFLTAIFLISIDSSGSSSSRAPGVSLLVLAGSLSAYWFLAVRLFSKTTILSSSGYFSTEKKLLILALVFFSGLLFVGDISVYLSRLSFDGRVPILANLAGLALFVLFLCLMWLAARKKYTAVFGKQYSRWSFILLNIRLNLPIVLPWITLSIFYDLINLAALPGISGLLNTTWGDLFFFGLFLVLVILFFPPLVRRLWGCTKLPEGPLRSHLEDFCSRQDFNAEFYVWPLFEGRVLTAAVMGLLPGLRYIMLTPALMQSMSIAELEAVTAHEIGHVKKYHLLLYVLLIGGFSIFAGFLAEPILYFFLSMDWIFSLMAADIISAETLIMIIGALPLLILLLLYFRFIFGYFIRNFERQADLYAFKVFGTGRSLIAAFQTIVKISGQPADRHNWHHFGIAERIAHLEACEQEPDLISGQDRKIRRSLTAYVLVLALAIGLIQQMPAEQLARTYEGKYIELVLMKNIQGVEDEGDWFRLFGDLLFSRQLEDKALSAYQKALEIKDSDPELLNNLAWLLLTAREPSLRNPIRALELARAAAETRPLPHVLDTLATAYWANGYIEEALQTESEALRADPSQSVYYRLQLKRFETENYSPDFFFIN
jgi:Zn-dependent protease with chaperone function